MESINFFHQKTKQKKHLLTLNFWAVVVHVGNNSWSLGKRDNTMSRWCVFAGDSLQSVGRAQAISV